MSTPIVHCSSTNGGREEISGKKYPVVKRLQYEDYTSVSDTFR